MQLVDHLVVQLRDIPGRTIRLRSQRVEQQDRPPQVLRFVDGVARGARGTDQEGRGARPIALALGGLDARFQEGWMLRREAERAVDQFLRVFHPAELTKEQRLCAQRFRAFAVVVQQRFFAVMERERLVLPPGGGEEASSGLEVGPVSRVQIERVLVADGSALRVSELLEEDSPHGVVHGRSGGNVAEGGRFAFQVRQSVLRSLDLLVARIALRGRNRKLLGDDRVHGEPEGTRAQRVQSASVRGGRALFAEGTEPLVGRCAALTSRGSARTPAALRDSRRDPAPG